VGKGLAFHVTDFSGGWNARDAPSELANNESPDLINVTFDERGGVIKRLGCAQKNTGTLSGPVKRLFYQATTQTTFVQIGADLLKTTDFATFTTVHTFTTTAMVGMADMAFVVHVPTTTGPTVNAYTSGPPLLVVIHPVDGLFTYNGTAFAAVTAVDADTPPKGNTLAVWQGFCWASGGPTSRVWRSAFQDPTKWTIGTTVDDVDNGIFIDIKEKDDMPVLCLGAGQGMDTMGRPGLLVFKEHSVHRIFHIDGQYTTMSTSAGACGPQAVTTARTGQICFMGERGIYITDGVKEPVLASGKLEPLFRPNQLNYQHLSQVCAGNYRDRVVFSMPRAGSTINNLTLEYHPTIGWFAPSTCAGTSFTVIDIFDDQLIAGAPGQPFIVQMYKGGSDMGTPITCRWQSKWFLPAAAITCRYRRLRVEGRGSFDLHVKVDYQTGIGQQYSIPSQGQVDMTWNVDKWNQASWGPTVYEYISDVYSLGFGKSVAVQLQQIGSTSAVAPKLLGDGAASEVGAFAVYGLRFDLFQLGLS